MTAAQIELPTQLLRCHLLLCTWKKLKPSVCLLSVVAGARCPPVSRAADEPTSGLDSFAALSVMSHLQGLAHHGCGKAVVAAIHQPRSAIWSLFDKVKICSGRTTLHCACMRPRKFQ
jgi:hypothetical protein